MNLTVVKINAPAKICDSCHGNDLEPQDEQDVAWIIFVANRGASHLCARCRKELIVKLGTP